MTWVRALQGMAVDYKWRNPGDTFEVSDWDAQQYRMNNLVELVRTPGASVDWHGLPGRELRQPVLGPIDKPRIVACLNIWNDTPALRQTLPSWIDLVDALHVVDGRYHGGQISTDGLIDYLAEINEDLPAVKCIANPDWPDQNAKRSTYFDPVVFDLRDGDICFVIDADESVALRAPLQIPAVHDVGWVTVRSPLYERPYSQPRLIRWQRGLAYRGRHHWIYRGDDLLTTHQYAAPGVGCYLAPLTLTNQRGLGQDSRRAHEKIEIRERQNERERIAATGLTTSDQAAGGRESLRIVQVGSIDPGMVMFRLHTAINTTTPHASIMARRMNDNPFGGPTQFTIDTDDDKVDAIKAMVETADVLHTHVDYGIPGLLEERGIVLPDVRVMHHHGTTLRNAASWFKVVDQRRAALRLISNFSLVEHAPDARWLPNPVPVAYYQEIRRRAVIDPDGPIRVGHSPSKRHLKGTDAFLEAIAGLQAQGVRVEPVLIEGRLFADSIHLKATCDLFFDSFWLGIQCSGIEAGAMGIPVIAGDPVVADHYRREIGSVPYLYANDVNELQRVLGVFIADPALRAHAGARVQQYVTTYHDDAAVALRYLELLDQAVGWRSQLLIGQDRVERRDLPPLRWPVPPGVEIHRAAPTRREIAPSVPQR